MAEEEKKLRPVRISLRTTMRTMEWIPRVKYANKDDEVPSAKYASKDDVLHKEHLLRLPMLPQFCPAILNISATQTQQPAI